MSMLVSEVGEGKLRAVPFGSVILSVDFDTRMQSLIASRTLCHLTLFFTQPGFPVSFIIFEFFDSLYPS